MKQGGKKMASLKNWSKKKETEKNIKDCHPLNPRYRKEDLEKSQHTVNRHNAYLVFGN